MSSKKRERIRNAQFRCCKKHGEYGNKHKRYFDCDECGNSWDVNCLEKKYGIYGRDVSSARHWSCPDCIAFKSDDSNQKHKKKSSKKTKRKKSKKSKKSKSYGSDYDEYDSSDNSFSSDDTKLKKLTKKMKEKKQKEKAIKNRLKNIQPKYNFKFDQKMLEISDSGTDEDFDSNTWYPNKMPKTDKSLESLRRQKCQKSKIDYLQPLKDTRYRQFEKKAIIHVIEDIAQHPHKYNYNPKFGWSQTDVAEHCAKYLWDFRTQHSDVHIQIPLRNAASIKSLFKRWEDSKNKETDEKKWISKYETAKQKVNKLAKKAASDVNEELENFGHEYASIQLKNTQKELKKYKQGDDVANKFKETLDGINVLIKDLKDDDSTNLKKNDNIEIPIKLSEAHNSYVDTNVINNCKPFSPTKNQQFMNKYSVNKNSEYFGSSDLIGNAYTFDDDYSSDNGNNSQTFPSQENKNFMGKYSTIKKKFNGSTNFQREHDTKIEQCCNFITQMSNSQAGPFDEVNEQTQRQTIECERALFDDKKSKKLAIKYSSLLKITPTLSKKEILRQLSITAALL